MKHPAHHHPELRSLQEEPPSLRRYDTQHTSEQLYLHYTGDEHNFDGPTDRDDPFWFGLELRLGRMKAGRAKSTSASMPKRFYARMPGRILSEPLQEPAALSHHW